MSYAFVGFLSMFLTAFFLCSCFLQRDNELMGEIAKRDAKIKELEGHLSGTVPGTEPGSLERAR